MLPRVLFLGPFTVFAPSNLAFARLGAATLNQLKSDQAALSALLKYHVVQGQYMSADLQVNEKMLTSLSGQNIRINYYMYYNVSMWQISYRIYTNLPFFQSLLTGLHRG